MLTATMHDFTAPVAPAVLTRASACALVTATYDAHQRELFSFALRSCRDRGIAEELVQEAFTRLFVEIEAARTPDNIRAWLYRVIANLAVSGGRRTTVARRRLGALAAADVDVDEGPEPAYLEHEREADLETALAELDVDARTALVMAACGFKGMEIADAIGRSGNATRTMMCRSRLRLRERLASIAPSA